MTYQTITRAVADNVATITLNVPHKLNACSLAMADEMIDAIDALGDAKEGGARAIIITGAGRAFCSGADLTSLASGSSSRGEGSFLALTEHYNPLMQKLAAINIPTICAVNGPAAGVGCSIALAADFVIAGASAYFLQAFVNIGLVPDGGASWMLPRMIGKARATEMMMLGEKIGADKAADWGLIYKSVADDALINEAHALATRLASGPTLALGIMRQNIAAALNSDYPSALQREAEGQRIAGDSSDATEGGVAFLQKRAAKFVGQ